MKIMASSPITVWQIDGETMEKVTDFIFRGSKIIADGDCSHEINRHLLLGRKAMTNLDSILKSRDITLPTMFCLVKALVFPVVMYGYKRWTLKQAERQRIDVWTVVLEKTLESPLDDKEIKSVSRKEDQSWIFTGRTDAEAPILWLPDAKNQLIGKDSDAQKDWRQEEKGTTEDEMVGWHHQLNGHEFNVLQELVMDQEVRGLAKSPQGRKELDMTEQLNWLTDKRDGFTMPGVSNGKIWRLGVVTWQLVAGIIWRHIHSHF